MQKFTGRETRATGGAHAVHRQALIARLNRRSVAATRSLRARLSNRTATRATSLSALLAATFRPFLSAERALPIAVASLVAIASLLALLPGTPASVGATSGSGASVRIAVSGGPRYQNLVDGGVPVTGLGFGAGPNTTPSESFQPVVLPGDPNTGTGGVDAGATPPPDQVLADGTLVTGYTPNTTVEDGSSLITTYRVRSGDTLSSIAAQFHVAMMTIWWANKLPSKTSLKVGMLLQVPTADGLIVTVTANDTLDSLASKYKVSPSDIVSINGLTDPVLVVGQVLIMPGARGNPIPTPKPTPRPATTSSSSHSSSGGSTSAGLGGSYSGGRLLWPVIGGGNYISQYYHYGHGAIDIAAQYGSTVVAAASGKVIFAGWKNNGGGWQVWISHGSNLFTTYNHMSAITVGNGQMVGRGEQVGRIGMSGAATGPHLHFEVWIGPIWNGGQRMNPLAYLN